MKQPASLANWRALDAQRPRHALIAFGAHRSPLALQASDHLPVKTLVATRELPRFSGRTS